MTRFTIGLLLGLLLGIGGATAFLITAGGGDYFVSASPRIRELENSLKTSDQDREWLRKRLNEANEAMARLESRFVALSARFESLGELATGSAAGSAGAGAPRTTAPAPDGEAIERHGAAPIPDGATATPTPGGARSTPRAATPAPEATALPAT